MHLAKLIFQWRILEGIFIDGKEQIEKREEFGLGSCASLLLYGKKKNG